MCLKQWDQENWQGRGSEWPLNLTSIPTKPLETKEPSGSGSDDEYTDVIGYGSHQDLLP